MSSSGSDSDFVSRRSLNKRRIDSAAIEKSVYEVFTDKEYKPLDLWAALVSSDEENNREPNKERVSFDLGLDQVLDTSSML